LAEYIKEEHEIESPNEEISVSIRIVNEDEWTLEYQKIKTKNNTVFKLLLEMKETYNVSLDYVHWQGYDAIFVSSINGTRNGEDNMWWQYYVNNIYGEIACEMVRTICGGSTM
jgi:hypothetical protein